MRSGVIDLHTSHPTQQPPVGLFSYASKREDKRHSPYLDILELGGDVILNLCLFHTPGHTQSGWWKGRLWRGKIYCPAKIYIDSFSEEPVFPKGKNGLRSDGIWSQQNFLSLNLQVNRQVGGMGALITPLNPTASSRNTSCSMCPRCIPWIPCSGIVSIWQPLSAVWDRGCKLHPTYPTLPTGNCSPKDQCGPHPSLLYIYQ